MTRVRKSAGIGVMYPESRERIIEVLNQSLGELRSVSSFTPEEPGDKVVSAVVVPHGPLKAVARPAAATYRRILRYRKTDSYTTFVIVGPNHSELGAPVAVYPDGIWITPLGEARVDEELAQEIARVDRYAELDEEAHRYEYSLELQLIFLQFFLGEIDRFIAVAVSDIANPDVAGSLAQSIVESARRLGRSVVVVATSEFGYYYSRDEAVASSQRLVECLKRLDTECLYKAVKHYNISVCAPAAIGVAAIYSKSFGCSTVKAAKVKLAKFRSLGFYTPYISATIVC